jgi:hypothetical protein
MDFYLLSDWKQQPTNTRFFLGWLWGKDEENKPSHLGLIKLIHQEARKQSKLLKMYK